MFGKKAKEDQQSRDDEFFQKIKDDMTNRAAIIAKQASTIDKLIHTLENERKELKDMRLSYEKKMKQDDQWFDRMMTLFEKRKQ